MRLPQQGEESTYNELRCYASDLQTRLQEAEAELIAKTATITVRDRQNLLECQESSSRAAELSKNRLEEMQATLKSAAEEKVRLEAELEAAAG